jgi:hypothetical protein
VLDVFIVLQVVDSEVLITSQRGLPVRESEAVADSAIDAAKLATADVVETELINSCTSEWNSAMLSTASEAAAPSVTKLFRYANDSTASDPVADSCIELPML